MANAASDRMGGTFGRGPVAAGARRGPLLVIAGGRGAGEVAGVRGSAGAALARDVAAGVLLLGAAAALWVGFFAATW